MALTPDENNFVLDAIAGTFPRGRMLSDREGLDVMAAMIPLLRMAAAIVLMEDHVDPAPAALTCSFQAWVAQAALNSFAPYPFAPGATITLTLSGGTAPTINGVAGPITIQPEGEKVDLTVEDTAAGTVVVTYAFTSPADITNTSTFSVIFS